jgi:hypothetical protein
VLNRVLHPASKAAEICLHHPHRFLSPDYSVFDCGRVALSEDKLSFGWEATGPILGGLSASRK